MHDPGSVTQLMQDGGEEAFWRLYVRFVLDNEALRAVVQRRLPSDRVADPVDILSDAFQDVWRKSLEGKHAQFEDRHNLLALLTVYAKGRADDARKRKRAVGDSSVRAGGEALQLGNFAAARPDLPDAQELQAAVEEIDDRLALLSEEQQQIARLALQGKTQPEIMAELGLPNVKRVERAFDAIRLQWTTEYTQSFAAAWEAGETPNFYKWYQQFTHGGRWLLKSLCEIELHQRLQRSLPLSLNQFRACVPADQHGYVEDVFQRCVFFDEHPSEAVLKALRDRVDPWFVEVLDLKCSGCENEAIAKRMKCSSRSIRDAMSHLRAKLQEGP